MSCCGRAEWKREEVPDHKFDFIDVRDYYNNGSLTRLKYVWLFALVVKSIAVYIADIYTAITLLAFNHFNGSIYSKVQDNPQNTIRVPFVYGRWIFTGCIIFSFLLLAYEAHKSRAIIRSRDISYAYTNVMANNYYSIRSYDHFCFFNQINNSKKKKDEFAFFIFFTFKGWKRLLVADGPRQVINALTLYALGETSKWSTNLNDYYEGNIFTLIMLLTMLFTVVVFAGSAILLIVATLMYLPLVCYIQGNLKEYCCHKIDKRISELVQKKKKQRLGKYAAIARAEAAGDFSHLMNKKGIIVGQKMQQPTLPQVEVDLLDDTKPALKRGASIGSSANGAYGVYGSGSEKNVYGGNDADEYGSTAHLVNNAGYAGGYYGHHTNASVESYGSPPSMPPTAHNSPDAYPMQVRGVNGLQQNVVRAASPSTNLLAQMGPIGTSPEIFAKKIQGRGYDGSDQTSTLSNGGRTHGKSPLAQGSGGGTYAESAGLEYSPPQHAHGVEGAEYPPPPPAGSAVMAQPPPADLSAYTPYSTGGDSEYLDVDRAPSGRSTQEMSRDNSGYGYEDVYDAYYHDDHSHAGGYSTHDTSQYNGGGRYQAGMESHDQQSQAWNEHRASENGQIAFDGGQYQQGYADGGQHRDESHVDDGFEGVIAGYNGAPSDHQNYDYGHSNDRGYSYNQGQAYDHGQTYGQGQSYNGQSNDHGQSYGPGPVHDQGQDYRQGQGYHQGQDYHYGQHQEDLYYHQAQAR